MSDLKINGITVSVEEGITVLAAAEMLGIEIPTLCHLKGMEPETSCMLCVVKNNATGKLIPSCSARVVAEMDIDTECAEVQSARRDILNLLLSEHVGDCHAPCQRICPAHLDIPLMLREMERGNMESAAWIAKRDLAIPATLGHICPAPCEKGCRRGQVDTAIAIHAFHRDVGRACSPSAPEWTARRAIPTKKAAVIGSGAAGLSCAWQLRQAGWDCTVFDERPVAGGSLRREANLPLEVLDMEIRWLESAGIEFRLKSVLPMDGFDVIIEPEEHKIAVMAVANGKAAALKAAGVAGKSRFDFKLGKVRDPEARELTKNCSSVAQASCLPDSESGRRDACGTEEEPTRCLHCDCRKPESCKLRRYADRYGADQREFPADERKHIELIGQGGDVVFEPGKCIKCGLCVKITKQAGGELGLAFKGRGFNTQVTVPFGESLQNGLQAVAKECVVACPTGALAFRDFDEFSI